MVATTHASRASLSWDGSTGAGYDSYNRAHTVNAAPAEAAVSLSSDPAFGGDPTLLNPEQLLVLAASSCQLLSCLAMAARARVDVVRCRDAVRAAMPEDDPPTRLTRIELHPVITIRSGADGKPTDDRLRHLCEVAHRECYVANSLRAEVVVEPVFRRENPEPLPV